MSLVIVTQNQYILAQRIHHIVLNEGYEYHDVRNHHGRIIGVRENTYSIYMLYTPEQTQHGHQNSREEVRECTVTMRGKVHAYRVYKDLIRQIREQMPDELFLHKALESLLSEEDFAKIAESETEDHRKCEEKMSVKAIARPRKIRAARKAKRTSKKVLRKSKRRH